MRADALTALTASNDPPRLFTRAGGIARVAWIHGEQKELVPVVQQLDATALRGELTNAADWFTLKHTTEGERSDPDLPPLAIAFDILALPNVDLPPLVAIITCPAFTREGALIVAEGYDAASGLWHHRTMPDLPAIAERPSRDAVASARDVLSDIIAEFPFIDIGSRVNALAVMLLPFVRHMIEGPTLAERCKGLHPDRAAELRQAAGLMTGAEESLSEV